jgi:pyruvate dehydrogenase E1 component alpha subunit
MAGERADGNDVLATRDVMRRAVGRAREESLPTLVEAVSFRMRGHSVVDPARYRSREEIDAIQRADPVAHYRQQLIEAEILSEDDAGQIEAEINKEVARAIHFADSSADPRVSDLFAYTYATPVLHEPKQFPGDSLFERD